ncbi:MAG: translation initiation factor IF-3 [Hyphomicrobiales bacterium]|nr:translation initiation factor IF-3 [Hyphomicrobiales bacterium]MDG1523718.1 translation initiation factor IF-3 [Hyphomicrobiales bacterium]MDG1664727.1 translation initiation factor IF-3 [Hyphomicrobiales bacterium]MDG2413972.1 translation initiation factor IF-3 [Hyphomicrobiales bacterium]
MSRQHSQTPPSSKGPRVNEQITAEEVLLIDASGEKKGNVPTPQAIEVSKEQGLDLVEISPKTNPPVCKVMDYGKYKFESQKKANQAKKKQKTIAIKEIKLRPNIDVHDYQVKMRSVQKFLSEGDKVKVTLRFRGREMAHQDRGASLLQKVKEEIDQIAKVEMDPKFEGRQMIMVLAPR